MDVTETVYMTVPHQHGGTPLQEGVQYEATAKFAASLYQRGLARPAAEVYLERLKQMGLIQIGTAEDAEPSLAKAAQALGLTATPLRAKKGKGG